MKNLSFLYIFSLFFGFSQNQTDNQYFIANAGYKYNYCTDSYTALTNSQFNIDLDQVQVGYSPATISDKYGNLLFYTDGRTVWDRNHSPLPNGNEATNTDIEGHGNTLILPQPGDSETYYLFTLDRGGFWNTFPDAPGPVPDDGINDGLTYSVIDLALNNGNGDIVPGQRNIPLVTYNENNNKDTAIKCSTKLTAVRGSDCQSYWIITHFKSNFYAFKLDDSGLNPIPVISTLTPLIDVIEGTNLFWYHHAGSMKSSPDGKKIAVAHTYLDNVEFNGLAGGVFLYDFDNETGKLSNTRTLFSGEASEEYPTSVAFSASSNYLYATTSPNLDTDNNYGNILRWNLQSVNIASSIQMVDNNDSYNPYLQLGSDKNIYKTLSAVANNDDSPLRYLGKLGEVDELLTDITYQRQGILIDPSGDFDNIVNNVPLPQFNSQWFNNSIDIIKNGISRCELFICDGESQTLSADNIDGASYVWSMNGVVLSNELSNELEVTEPGFYEVFIEPNDGRCPMEGRATVLVSNDVPTAQNTSVTQCGDNSNNNEQTIFNLSQLDEAIANFESNRNVFYYESLSDLNNRLNQLEASSYANISNPQTIYALVESTETGCSAVAEVTLSVSTNNVSSVELSVCDSDENDGFSLFDLTEAESLILNELSNDLSISFYANFQNAQTGNSPLPLDYINTTPYNQVIYARIVNNLDCFGISEIFLKVDAIPELEAEEELLYCINTSPQTITLSSGISETSAYSFLWSTGEMFPEIEVNETGQYSVIVTNENGCSTEKLITVSPSNIATITNIEVVDASEHNSIAVFASGEGDYEYALNDINGVYQDSSIFDNVQPGLYTVYVRDKNNCGISEQLVSVIGFPKFFTPNNDDTNDFWQVNGMTSQFQANSSIYIFDRYGKLLTQVDPLGPGWDGTYNGVAMPTNDYWFKVTLADGRTFTSHFTLKR